MIDNRQEIKIASCWTCRMWTNVMVEEDYMPWKNHYCPACRKGVMSWVTRMLDGQVAVADERELNNPTILSLHTKL